MSSLKLVFRGLIHYWRLNLALALGVAVATAVLCGALLVGDSMRGSLRDVITDRLGRIDEVLVSDHFLRTELAAELAADPGFQEHFDQALPAIILRGSLETPLDQAIDEDSFAPADENRSASPLRRRAAGVNVIGCDPRFWSLERRENADASSEFDQRSELVEGQIILNEPLARQLGVSAGEDVLLRLPRPTTIPADSALGRKAVEIPFRRLTVSMIIPATGLGQFSLHPSQQPPRNAYVTIDALQYFLRKPGNRSLSRRRRDRRQDRVSRKINAILVSGKNANLPPSQRASQQLQEMLKPRLEDYGFAILHVRQTYTPQSQEKSAEEESLTAFEYDRFSSDRMMLTGEVAKVAQRAFGDFSPQPVLTFMANTIGRGPAEDGPDLVKGIPYSTITAIDNSAVMGPLVDREGKPIDPLQPDEIALTSWTAEQLGAKIGDKIHVAFFEPESTHGYVKERVEVFRLAAIIPLTEPEEAYEGPRSAKFTSRPTLSNDPWLTPEVPGVTDQDSLDDWEGNAPFPYDSSRVTSRDDDYWSYYRTTPKAYVSLKTGQRLWGSRFGQITSYRWKTPKDISQANLAASFYQQIESEKTSVGFAFRPIKRLGLEAATGTTPFNALFLGFSMFIIAAALMLVALLFRLGVDGRVAQIGVMMAVGLSPRRVGWIIAAEGILVAVIGGFVGTLAGVGYARMMLAGLNTWWVEAISTPFVRLHVSPSSLGIAYISSLSIAACVILWSIRQVRRLPVQRLISGQSTSAMDTNVARTRRDRWAPGVLTGLSIGLGLTATQLGGEAQAGAFFGSGMMIQAAMLMVIRARLRHGSARPMVTSRGGALLRLAARSGGRNPLRSTLTIGLVAVSSFLIIAISAFRLDPTEAGSGGFQIIVETDQPVHYDLNTQLGRQKQFDPKETGEAQQDISRLSNAEFMSFRVRGGDDASCLNLFQSQQPRVLGVSEAMILRAGFEWAATAAESDDETENPWMLLNKPLEDDEIIPVVIDMNTAMYSLHLWTGVGEQYEIVDEAGSKVTLQVVGMLKNSIFQGNLLISNRAFTKLFPSESGSRYLLIESEQLSVDEINEVLVRRIGDKGVTTETTRDRMGRFLAVQNTYLSTFQSLGALGLLLGTFGLASVQLRNILERRGELALMRATGFRRARLAQMVLFENAMLLLVGLFCGVLSALVAVLPHLASGGATIPWLHLGAMLGVIIIVGLLVGLLTVRATLKAPLLPALRGD